MKNIQVLNFKSSGLDPVFNAVSSVQMEDEPLGKGAFGEVYYCSSINGVRVNTPQVIKQFIDNGNGSAAAGYATIVRLQEKMIEYNTKNKKKGEKNIQQINALAALPQFSFEGMLDGNKILGYSAMHLPPGRYFLFDKMFNGRDAKEKKHLLNSFYNLPVGRRLKMAFDLAEGFKALQEMSFVHADLNPSNFFVNTKDDRLCIIDYDSGAVIESRQNEAMTFGKMGEWLAPEIQQQLIADSSGSIKVDLNTDTWSVAIAIHFLLFHYHPLFYLKKRGVSQMDAYFRVNAKQWPEIHINDPNFQTKSAKIYETYIAKLKKEIPRGIVECFAETINNGYYDPGRRISYAQWISRIGRQMEPPAIEYFLGDKLAVICGVPLRLKWLTDKAHTLVINNGIGDVTGKTEVCVYPQSDTMYTLTAIGHFGEEKENVYVKVLPMPEMPVLKIPLPVLEMQLNIDFPRPPRPPQESLVNTGKIVIPAFSASFISPESCAYNPVSLYNKITNGLNIGAIFDTIIKKMEHALNHTK